MIDLKKYNQAKYKKKKKKAIKMLDSYKGKESSIEKKIREFLQKEGIHFIQEYGVNHILRKKPLYKVYDFYLSGVNDKGNQYNFLIETDGFFFHAHEYLEGNLAYSKLSKLQKRNLRNDKLKNEIAKSIGLPLLRLKEKDINNNFQLIKETIYNMINRF